MTLFACFLSLNTEALFQGCAHIPSYTRCKHIQMIIPFSVSYNMKHYNSVRKSSNKNSGRNAINEE